MSLSLFVTVCLYLSMLQYTHSAWHLALWSMSVCVCVVCLCVCVLQFCLCMSMLQYTHSAWHLALSLSLLALLPDGGRRPGLPSDRLPLVADGDGCRHELAELGTGSPTFCRPDLAAPAAAAAVGS